jgi:G3E family GTPase
MLALAERTTTVEVRLEKAATVVGHMNKRLTAVEQQVRAGTLTEEQAREIQHRVNLIAREMVKQAPLNLLEDIGHYRLKPPAATHHHEHDEHCDHDHDEPDHGLQFSTWSYETQRPFSRLALREAIKQLPETIFRAKGVLAVADLPDRRVILQVVGRRMQMSVGAAWEDERPQSQLVVIGTPDGVKADELTVRFDACLVGPAQAVAKKSPLLTLTLSPR